MSDLADLKDQADRIEKKVDQLLALAAVGAVFGNGASSAPRTASGSAPAVFPNYGKAKGMPVAGAPMKDLEWYAEGCRKSLGNPEKAKWHDRERAMLDAIEAEMAKQRGDGPAAPVDDGDFGPPPF